MCKDPWGFGAWFGRGQCEGAINPSKASKVDSRDHALCKSHKYRLATTMLAMAKALSPKHKAKL